MRGKIHNFGMLVTAFQHGPLIYPSLDHVLTLSLSSAYWGSMNNAPFSPTQPKPLFPASYSGSPGLRSQP